MAEIIAMPKLGFDMAEGTLVRWLIGEGEPVEKGQILAEIETDKATVEIESTASGVLHRHMVEEGAVVPVGDPIAVVAAPGEGVMEMPTAEPTAAAPESAAEQPTAAQAPVTPEVAAGAGERIKASPLAWRMATEAQLDLRTVTGTGPSGRIVRRDIEKALATAGAKRPVVPEAALSGMKPVAPLPIWQPGAEIPADQRVPVDRLRALIGRRMTESKQQLPHFYVTSEIDAKPMLDLRAQVNKRLPDEQKLSINDFAVKAAAMALREFTNINATLAEKEIIHHGHINVGVAVALDVGLMTVVCKDADQKPIRLISKEVREMAARAREGKVRPEDIEGSTFSLSNLGMYDVENFAAIINPPEAAILAVASVKETPVVVDGQVKAGWRMKATLSADHRITDGAEAARFMQTLTEFLENPLWLIL